MPSAYPYQYCTLCPRKCGANRFESANTDNYCRESASLRLAAASIHRGEEPPITGKGGSGIIFVTGCNLCCIFCQNRQISHKGMGQAVTEDEFVRICLELQGRGAENVNIVTGSHAVPAIVQGIKSARIKGLNIPLLWNSSAYESLDALDLLKDTADVYMPDLKTLDTAIAGRFFNAPDYPENAEKAIIQMMKLRKLQYGSSNKIKNSLQEEEISVLISGVIIRHLVLPDHLEATKNVLRWFAEKAQGRALLSLMTQYTPVPIDGHIPSSIPNRLLNTGEYETVLKWLDIFDIGEGFYQELITDKEWLPDFERINPFSSELSVPVWHWKHGFVEDTT